jgi:hypothetical protein
MVDGLMCCYFEHVTLLSLSFVSLSIHYKASHIPNYIVIPMFLNKHQLYEMVRYETYFKAEMKVCFEVSLPFIPGCMHACLLIKSELFLKL